MKVYTGNIEPTVLAVTADAAFRERVVGTAPRSASPVGRRRSRGMGCAGGSAGSPFRLVPAGPGQRRSVGPCGIFALFWISVSRRFPRQTFGSSRFRLSLPVVLGFWSSGRPHALSTGSVSGRPVFIFRCLLFGLL